MSEPWPDPDTPYVCPFAGPWQAFSAFVLTHPDATGQWCREEATGLLDYRMDLATTASFRRWLRQVQEAALTPLRAALGWSSCGDGRAEPPV
jgi:hypothetical protein